MAEYKPIIRPTKDEIESTVLNIVRHALHVEYYCNELEIGSDDRQRPHDLVGHANKLDWPVLSGLAVADRDPSREFFNENVLPSIIRHRKGQNHHIWHMYNPYSSQDQRDMATIDMICSRFENRRYQAQVKTVFDLSELFMQNQHGYHIWSKSCWKIANLFETIPRPELDKVESIYDIPNIGVSNNIHKKLVYRVNQTLQNLKYKDYDFYE